MYVYVSLKEKIFSEKHENEKRRVEGNRVKRQFSMKKKESTFFNLF